MSLLLLTVTLRGVSNKHCLLSLFSLELPFNVILKNIHIYDYKENDKIILKTHLSCPSELLHKVCLFSLQKTVLQ